MHLVTVLPSAPKAPKDRASSCFQGSKVFWKHLMLCYYSKRNILWYSQKEFNIAKYQYRKRCWVVLVVFQASRCLILIFFMDCYFRCRVASASQLAMPDSPAVTMVILTKMVVVPEMTSRVSVISETWTSSWVTERGVMSNLSHDWLLHGHLMQQIPCWRRT